MFNPDNCGMRLIPSTELDKWVQEMQYKYPKEGKLFALESSLLLSKSISPTEEQFLQCMGEDEIELED